MGMKSRYVVVPIQEVKLPSCEQFRNDKLFCIKRTDRADHYVNDGLGTPAKWNSQELAQKYAAWLNNTTTQPDPHYGCPD